MRQDKRELSLELLVDIFKAIKTLPDEQFISKKINQIEEIKIKITEKQFKKYWNKYTNKMLTSSTIMYIFVSKTFKIRKEMNNRPEKFKLDGVELVTNPMFWNITDQVIQLTGRDLLKEENKLSTIKNKIINYFQENYRKTNTDQTSSPIFEFREEPRIVAIETLKRSNLFRDFDLSNIVFFINGSYCLRTSTSDFNFELLDRGYANFIVQGAGFLKLANSFPCQHYLTGVRTFTAEELFGNNVQSFLEDRPIHYFFDDAAPLTYLRSAGKQNIHNTYTVQLLREQMCRTFTNLAKFIFAGTRLEGAELSFTVIDDVDSFAFCYPTYRLEILCDGSFKEIITCGVTDQRLLSSAKVANKVGFSFLICLENIANIIHNINDLRDYWRSQNSTSPDNMDINNIYPDIVEYNPNLWTRYLEG
uniref:Phenylalanyl-tRNA synthetase domain-containing protein n=1 Tax=Meloidogyne enterolobii TaxID=390850 RepID=A0A6V7TJC6_MELEN|nr:unnamed protein product [Meloidogyne enterolobii]